MILVQLPNITQGFCVFSSTGAFTVAFSGLNADFNGGTNFNMANATAAAATDFIEYTVTFNNDFGNIFNATNDAVASATFDTSGADQSCALYGGPNSSISTAIDQPTFDAAANNDSYSDVLTMLYTAI